MDGQGALAPLASEIQEIFGNFKALYQLRKCVMTSWDLNVCVRRKNIKLCPPPSMFSYHLGRFPQSRMIHTNCRITRRDTESFSGAYSFRLTLNSFLEGFVLCCILSRGSLAIGEHRRLLYAVNDQAVITPL